jgi:glycosyltransferase involved in cell wall biosynthesis
MSEGDAGSLVSVVIPCHDHGRFLREAVESVQRQTLPGIEIVVVDDGSTDETASVLAGLTGIHVIRQDCRGLSAARNRGWQASRGRYLVFLDADDRLPPTALEIGVAHARAHPEAAFVSGHHALIDATGAHTGTGSMTCVTEHHYRALLRSNYIGMHATVVYRRETLDRFGDFDPSLRACEDYDLFLRVARQAPIVCHPDLVAEYRRHGANMSRNRGLMLRSALTVLRRQRRHVRGRPADEQAYRDGVRFWRHLFGDPLLDEVPRAVAAREWGRTARALIVLAREHPWGLARRALSVARRLGRRALGR